MIPFSLIQWKKEKNQEIVTVCGEPAKIVYTEGLGNRPVLAVIYDGDTTDSAWYSIDGKDFRGEQGLYFKTKSRNNNLKNEVMKKFSELKVGDKIWTSERPNDAFTIIRIEDDKRTGGRIYWYNESENKDSFFIPSYYGIDECGILVGKSKLDKSTWRANSTRTAVFACRRAAIEKKINEYSVAITAEKYRIQQSEKEIQRLTEAVEKLKDQN